MAVWEIGVLLGLFALGNLFLIQNERRKLVKPFSLFDALGRSEEKKSLFKVLEMGDVECPLKVPSQYLFCAWEIKRRYGHRYECERNKFHRDFLSVFLVPADESKISQIDSGFEFSVVVSSLISIGTDFKVVLQASAGVGVYCKMFS